MHGSVIRATIRSGSFLVSLVLLGTLVLSPSSTDDGVLLRHGAAAGTAPTASALGWSSANWSGYAVTAGPYYSATSTWTVPTISPSATPTYSSTWVGIDGFKNSELIQAGTAQDYHDGAAHYSAWWEILPAAGVVISSVSINAGDRMSAAISQDATGGTWTISLANLTTGVAFSTSRPYAGPGASAEWIHEAPTLASRTTTLASFSSTTIRGTANGRNPGLTANNGGAMVQGGVRVSTPSLPDASGGFSLTNTRLPGAATLSARSAGSAMRGIRLTWTAAAANGSTITSYRIYRVSSTGAKTLIAIVANGRAYTDTGATRNRTTTYQVVAVSSIGAGPASDRASARSN